MKRRHRAIMGGIMGRVQLVVRSAYRNSAQCLKRRCLEQFLVSRLVRDTWDFQMFRCFGEGPRGLSKAKHRIKALQCVGGLVSKGPTQDHGTQQCLPARWPLRLSIHQSREQTESSDGPIQGGSEGPRGLLGVSQVLWLRVQLLMSDGPSLNSGFQH